jgi:capsid protein
MNILGIEINIGKKQEESQSRSVDPRSYYFDGIYGHNYTPIARVWDGEKTLGELGSPIMNVPDYNVLRIRSYDAYTKSDIVRIITSKYFHWVVGSGLKLQAEPNEVVLESEGIALDLAKFQKMVEARFMIYAKSKQADYLKQKSLHEIALDALQGKVLGGDVLAIMRFDDNGPNLQIVSGSHVKSPGLESEYFTKAEDRGNNIKHGVEVDKKGKHVAYYVCKESKDNLLEEFDRIEAIGLKTGKTMAWLISAKKISPDHVRAVPEISQSLEKIAKLDRYTEAAVGKAEQAAKISNFIKHDKSSTGEDPYRQMVAAKRFETTEGSENPYVLGDGLANRITETTSNQTFNMPIGATIEQFSTNIESDFGVFHAHVFNIISAGLEVPPEVAMQMYNSNYSASRAAINAWGYVVDNLREKIANEVYVPFYKAWLEFEIIKNKIDAPDYVKAVNTKNFMALEAYAQCRFTGKNMPHIDPLKEVKAINEALLQNLISREQATENLGYGSWEENFKKKMEEDKLIPEPKVETDKSKGNGKEEQA